MKRLEGKTALVTGAARGIGAAIASAFVEHGATVYLTDIDEALGQSVATALGPQASYFHLDVREERDCPMRRFGHPQEVAAVAVLLASDEVTYMNGAELNIDGGILAGAVAAPAVSEAAG